MKKSPPAPPPPALDAATVEAQGRALDALALGESPQAAAAAAGVPLGELLTWCVADAQFIAAHNRRRRVGRMLHVEQLRALAGRALEVIAATLEDEAAPPAVRLKAAEALLRGAEALPAPTWGPESAEEVRGQWADARAQKASDDRMRELLRGL